MSQPITPETEQELASTFIRMLLRIYNPQPNPVSVSVSKTLGEGMDGEFPIDPGGKEEWKRHVGYRVTIKLYHAGMEWSMDHVMQMGTNNDFHVTGDYTLAPN